CIAHGLNREVAMIQGTVKFFNSTKGFGFIAPENGGKDAFVHISALERAGISGLAEGQKVTYDIERGRDGRESAINVQLAWSALGRRHGAPPSKREAPMQHKFALGQMVELVSAPTLSNKPTGPCRVVMRLPFEGRRLQYRIQQ